MNTKEICYLFGQRDTPNEKRSTLYQAIEHLVTNRHIKHFILGNQGNFDRIALDALRQIKQNYPFVRYQIILAYYPLKPITNLLKEETIFPAELATIPKRFAISHRNLLMLKQSSIVLCYAPYSYGNSAQLLTKAQHLKKEILQI